MIRHQDISSNSDWIKGNELLDPPQQKIVIFLSGKDRLLIHATIVNMIKVTGIMFHGF